MADREWHRDHGGLRPLAITHRPYAISHQASAMMRVRVFVTAEALGRALALDVARRLAGQPDTVLGLPTGRTPIPFYRELVRLHRAGRVDFSRATTFNLDEFHGLRAVDPRSYRAFMWRHLFDHVNLSPRRIHIPDGAARDAGRECERYERAIE